MSKKQKTKRNKPYIPNKNKQVKPESWDDLTHVGRLTVLDIQQPHMIVAGILSEHKDLLEKDKDLSDLCHGLNQSYYDCFDKCLEIMAGHVESDNFPKSYKDLIDNPDALTNVVFKTGEVGKGIEDKSKLLEETLLYQSLHAKYHELAHHISALTVKGKTEMEQRLIATKQIDKTLEESQKEHDSMMESLELSETVLTAIKEQNLIAPETTTAQEEDKNESNPHEL